MLVLMKMDVNLREYLQQNQLTWEEKIRITFEIIIAIFRIHQENAIHRDLHSKNILYSQLNDYWRISDLGFCGPADKPSTSIYGNLPYIAPEVIAGKEYTFASDIYSIAMLMWEISSGQPPFINYEYDYDLAVYIINGMRPKIVSGTPLEYKSLIEQCWNANPLKRPNVGTLWRKIAEMNLSYNQIKSNKNKNIKNFFKKKFNLSRLFKSKTNNNLEINKDGNIETNYTSSRLFTSKVYQFENLPEPKNATEEEQEAFHSKSYDFNIPDNIDDFINSSSHTIEDNFILPKVFGELQMNLKNDIQVDYIKVLILQQMKRYENIDDEDDIYNSPNLHPEEQDELKFFK
ncbi:kinase-like domain-containing protein [Glomus cerebriforme]|uniref:Kinase-like domain-containing protein n=1 Tax=Glomus cerebriforme TaxID=658196 RepID=A0A397SCJ1_9GLOM|nr:kinase-like domain-containing protein [Glomus cerebriforme]